MSNGTLPDYISMAKPNPMENRAPWYKNTAPTYAGIMLWFVFWTNMPSGGGAGKPGGVLSHGILVALLGLVAAALLCHFLFYLVPGLLGMKTGLPLYVVGSSTYGAQGGFIMPGFLMGLLQFGWLGVNAFFSSLLLAQFLDAGPGAQKIIAVFWAAIAAFVGLKGIQYVAKVATFLPAIPLVILIILVVKSLGGVGDFDPEAFVAAGQAANADATELVQGTVPAGLGVFGVIALCLSYVIGFFATAGAAGTDFGMNNSDQKNVQMGGLIGISLATVFAGGASLLIAAGAFGLGGDYFLNTADANFMGSLMGSDKVGRAFGLLLVIAAFPPACFSSFIAANSFKTTLPKVNPFASVGVGTAVSILLAVTGWAGQAGAVFTVIGASFGPICGAMMVDYLLAGKKWAGPRAGFNPAGWISWAVGFLVGIAPLVNIADIPAAPLVAFIVGAVLYFVLAKAGLESKTLGMPSAETAGGPAEASEGSAQQKEAGA